MNTKDLDRQIDKKAKELGAYVQRGIGGRHQGMEVFAPKGKIWNCDWVHSLICEIIVGIDNPRGAMLDLLDRMNEGLSDCDIEDCDCGED